MLGSWAQPTIWPMRTLSSAVLAVTLALAAPAAGPGTLSPERLARIDTVFQQYVDENRIGGAVGLVLQDGKPVYERAAGWADKEAGAKMAPDTIFRIASQTKALTSVAILSLMEEGKLSLTDPVSRYIPSFTNSKVAVGNGARVDIVPAKRPITIRDLLTHTAGISYGTDPIVAAMYEAKGLGPAAGFGWFTADKDEPICVTMERLGTLPFVAQPGEAWVYGYNTDILGCIVEKASGTPLDAFIKARITGPLGMKDTQFFLAPAQRAAGGGLHGHAGGHGEAGARRRAWTGLLRRRPAQELRGRRRPDRPPRATTRAFWK